MNVYIKTFLLALASGSVGAAVVKLIGDLIIWHKTRKAQKEDHEEQSNEERIKEIVTMSLAMRDAMKFVLYDRIRYLGQTYIAEGEIDFDDRRILNDMHRSYHSGLFGNGDLDGLMSEVNHLPLKIKKKQKG